MLLEPNCYKKKCKHYQSVKWLGKTESTERNICTAFPKGIPEDIAYGNDKHLKKHPDQDNDILFEPIEEKE